MDSSSRNTIEDIFKYKEKDFDKEDLLKFSRWLKDFFDSNSARELEESVEENNSNNLKICKFIPYAINFVNLFAAKFDIIEDLENQCIEQVEYINRSERRRKNILCYYEKQTKEDKRNLGRVCFELGKANKEIERLEKILINEIDDFYKENKKKIKVLTKNSNDPEIKFSILKNEYFKAFYENAYLRKKLLRDKRFYSFVLQSENHLYSIWKRKIKKLEKTKEIEENKKITDISNNKKNIFFNWFGKVSVFILASFCYVYLSKIISKFKFLSSSKNKKDVHIIN